MNKQLKFLIPFGIFLIAASYTNAQLAVSSSATNFEADMISTNPVTLSLSDNINNDKATINNYELITVDESKFLFTVSEDFGSYVIPNTNYLKIVASDGKTYTKATLSNKNSGVAIFSLELDTKKNVVDMSNTKPGVYTLTLTNKFGATYKEDIMIM